MTKLTKHKIIALTGMSGAGKSTVSRIFSENGFYVIDCDKVAREVTEVGQPALIEIQDKLSSDVINSDGSLNRRATSELIFNNNAKRSIFNRIIYPYITYNIVCKIKKCDSDILLDAPTVFEAELTSICDKIVSVCARPEICIERIITRDNIPEELARARVNAQHDIRFFRENTDYCIENNGTEEQLFKAVRSTIYDIKVVNE